MALCSRVNSVGEIQLWSSSNSLQKKGDEARLMFLGKLREDGSESVEVLAPPVRWDEHSGDNQLHTRVLRPSSRQNLVEILPGGFQRNATQSVISTQGENQDVNPAFQNPVEAAQSAGCGFSAETGVHDFEVPSQAVDAFL